MVHLHFFSLTNLYLAHVSMPSDVAADGSPLPPEASVPHEVLVDLQTDGDSSLVLDSNK